MTLKQCYEKSPLRQITLNQERATCARGPNAVNDVKLCGPQKGFVAQNGCQTYLFDFRETDLQKSLSYSWKIWRKSLL